MDFYTQKKRSKFLLFILAILIIGASIFYTNVLVNRFAKEERKNVRLWAAAVGWLPPIYRAVVRWPIEAILND